jgi:hypothetical protein
VLTIDDCGVNEEVNAYDGGDDVDLRYDPFDESTPDTPSPLQTSTVSPVVQTPHQLPSVENEQPVDSQVDQVSTFCLPHSNTSSTIPHTPSRGSSRKTPEEKLADFLSNGCGCKAKCSGLFDAEYYQAKRDHCLSLTKQELDLVVLGQIMANIHTSSVVGPRYKNAPSPRQRSRVDFYHHGQRICKVTFLILHGIGKVAGGNNN